MADYQIWKLALEQLEEAAGEKLGEVYALACAEAIRAALSRAEAAPQAATPSDDEIVKIASEPATAPVSPAWLKGDVLGGDVRKAVIRFARAVLAEFGGLAVAAPDHSAHDHNMAVPEGWKLVPVIRQMEPADEGEAVRRGGRLD